MIRKRIEETDDQGRTVTTIIKEPDRVDEARDTTVMEARDAGVVDERDDRVVEEYGEETVHHGPSSALAASVAMLGWWVGLAGLAVLALLTFRVGFELADANASNSFVEFIYDITGPLVQPFQGIANARTLDGGGVFNPETAIAMGVYLIATALVMLAIGALARMIAATDHGPVVQRTRMVRGH